VSPTTVIGVVLLVFALAFVPDKYKPMWIYRLSWWQVLIGLIATVAALLIVMNPEFLALGILGDSTFFDLLVFAIGIQLQVILARIGVQVLAGGARLVRFIRWRFCFNCLMLVALVVDDIASTIQRVVQRFTS
jgi:hypothetical protein